jgi:hypothetical protein
MRRLRLIAFTLAVSCAPAAPAATARPRPAPASAYVVEEPDLLAEGIAFAPRTRTLYVGSEYKGRIVAVDARGASRPFATGLLAVLGLRVDEAHGLLWAATNGEAGTLTPSERRGTSELVAFDLATGEPRRRVVLRDADKHLLNDVAIAADGAAYVTDSEGGTVLRLAPAADALEPFVPRGTFRYPNGIAFLGEHLYVADGAGVARVDERGVHPLAHDAAVELRGVDGLYACGGDLLAVQNGRRPGRIARFRLDGAHDRVTGVTVLDQGSLPLPTTGALDGGAFLAVANSDIDALTEDGLRPGSRPRTTVVRIDGACD